jgi:hypothetical protein
MWKPASNNGTPFEIRFRPHLVNLKLGRPGAPRPSPLPTTPLLPPQAYPPLCTISTLSFLYRTIFAYYIHRVCSLRTLLRFLHQAWTPPLSNLKRPSWIIRSGRPDNWPDRPPYRESPLHLWIFVRSHVPTVASASPYTPSLDTSSSLEAAWNLSRNVHTTRQTPDITSHRPA